MKLDVVSIATVAKSKIMQVSVCKHISNNYFQVQFYIAVETIVANYNWVMLTFVQPYFYIQSC